MRTKLFIWIIWLAGSVVSQAQQTPSEVKYKIWDIHALRHFPFKQKADSIAQKAYDRYYNESVSNNGDSLKLLKQTKMDFVINKEYLDVLTQYSSQKKNILYRYIFNPYSHWIDYAEPIQETGQDIALTLHENEAGIFSFPGDYTINKALEDMIGEMSIFDDKNDVLLRSLSGPLGRKSMHKYNFFYSSERIIDDIPCYEVVFISKNPKDRATQGFLYISKKDYSVVKAIFTVNYSLGLSFGRNILMTHSFIDNQVVDKETRILQGNDIEGALLISQYEKPDIQESTIDKRFLEKADNTFAWKNTQSILSLFLTGHVGLGKKKRVELGNISQMISYNRLEGTRLRIGGRTTTALNNHFSVKGYVAYGLKDEKIKYRGDIIYSLNRKKDSFEEFPKSLVSFTYVDDFNIPGEDLLTSNRDRIFHSISHTAVESMSRQRIAKLSFEQEFESRFSMGLMLKYMHDSPHGLIRYDEYDVSEAGLSLRYAPGEKYIQLGDKRRYLKRGDYELEISHRIGINNLFGSDYNYNITEFNASKRFYLPKNVGNIELGISGGKIWDNVPFPILFIPQGNQSYIFSQKNYNLIDFYEFATDRYLAANLNFQVNNSPFNWISSKLKIKTHIGGKILYGPLSEKNSPEAELFHDEVQTFGDTPYLELNIGFSNIFRFLRVDYVRRATYTDKDCLKGSLFFGTSFAF